MVFQLVQQFRNGAKGGYVTVKNNGAFPGMPEELRIKVDGVSAYEFVTEGDTSVAEVEQTAKESTETDEAIIARIRERFEILDEMTKAATNKPTNSEDDATCIKRTSKGTTTEVSTSGRGRMWGV
jgi:hypothetical protein